MGSALGIAGVIFHVGSHRGAGFEPMLPQIVHAMQTALEDAPEDVWLCIENNAGTGNSVGSTWEEIGAIMDGVGSGRVKVCLDTCHAYASGYDLSDRAAFETAMERFDREIGFENLVAVHANDSKTPLGAGKDRHENIGAGTMGLGAFRARAAASSVPPRRLPAGGSRLQRRRPRRGERRDSQGAAGSRGRERVGVARGRPAAGCRAGLLAVALGAGAEASSGLAYSNS